MLKKFRKINTEIPFCLLYSRYGRQIGWTKWVVSNVNSSFFYVNTYCTNHNIVEFSSAMEEA